MDVMSGWLANHGNGGIEFGQGEESSDAVKQGQDPSSAATTARDVSAFALILGSCRPCWHTAVL